MSIINNRSSTISDSRSDDNRRLFMFVRRDDGRYIMYKIDALGHYNLRVPEVKILPLIVFKYGILPDCECSFAYIDPYFYVVGEKKHDVYILKKEDLVDLPPSKNTRGAQFVSQITTPMLSDKSSPLAFAYQDRLYVISKAHSTLPNWSNTKNDFEVYSPCEGSWSGLGSKPLRDCDINSFVVIGTMVYFTTSIHTVMSFCLKRAHWSTVYDPYGVTCVDNDSVPNPSQYFHVPTFDAQVQLIQNRIFGGLYRPGQRCFDFCASSSSNPSAKLFMRPTPNYYKRVMDAFCSCGCDVDEKSSLCSSYVVTMDGRGEIICMVCYGSDFSHDDPSNYVALTFFKVLKPSESEGDKLARCFKFDCVHRTRLLITSQMEFTRGVVSNCIFV